MKSLGYLAESLLKSGDIVMWCAEHKVQIKSMRQLQEHGIGCFYEIAQIEDNDKLPIGEYVKGIRSL